MRERRSPDLLAVDEALVGAARQRHGDPIFPELLKIASAAGDDLGSWPWPTGASR